MLDDEGHIIEPPDEDEEEADLPQEQDDIPQYEAPPPASDNVDMGGFQAFNPPQQPPWPMHQFMERFDQIEHRQMQMMELLQQNTEAIARIEDKLSGRR